MWSRAKPVGADPVIETVLTDMAGDNVIITFGARLFCRTQSMG